MTPVQKLRARGFAVSLKWRGRPVTTDTKNDAGNPEALSVTVTDETAPQDPTSEAKQKLPMFVTLTGANGAVKDPQAIGTFTEVDGSAYYTVIYFTPCTDAVTAKWFCEAHAT